MSFKSFFHSLCLTTIVPDNLVQKRSNHLELPRTSATQIAFCTTEIISLISSLASSMKIESSQVLLLELQCCSI